jgi:tetraacyldisaccharide 4'-kinase
MNGGSTESIESLTGQKIAAFCGIGNPGAFRRTLSDLGADVVAFREFSDHHPYARADVTELNRWASESSATTVVTTQKDWVKLRMAELGSRPLWALRIGIEFLDGQEAFDSAVLTAVERAD